MTPYHINYHKPSTVDEAIALMQKHEDECKILAGGQSLIPVMRLRLADPENLIDISGIEELKSISSDENSITIGAAVTHGTIAKNADVATHIPMVSLAAGMIGDIQVRNFGTIGGSIAHADPAADWPAVLLAADATLHIAGPGGKRTVGVDEFFFGLFSTALEEEEILTAVSIPKTAANRNSTYQKFVQPASRFAIVGCAAAVAKGSGSVDAARVAFSGVSSAPFRDQTVEKSLLSGASIDDATAAVAADVSIMSDHFADEKYRRHLAGVYARKALHAIA